MSKVYTGTTTSLDGYVSGPDESGFDRAEHLRELVDMTGVLVVGPSGSTAAQIARRCLEAGRLDEIWVDLAPVLLGGGRPFLEEVGGAPYALEGPVSVVQGERVTHLRYRVRKDRPRAISASTGRR